MIYDIYIYIYMARRELAGAGGEEALQLYVSDELLIV